MLSCRVRVAAVLVAAAAWLAGPQAQALQGPGVVTVRPGPPWLTSPSAAQLAAAAPPGDAAASAKVECHLAADGRLQLCKLRDVRGGGATEAAVNSLLPAYRLSPADAAAVRSAGGDVVFYLGWRSDSCAPPSCLGVTPPPPPPPSPGR